MTEPLAISENQRGEVLLTEYVRSISTGGGKPGAGYAAVMVDKPTVFHATQDPISSSDVAPKLGATSELGVHAGLAVRRLTPVERERLQGWPDGWTEWGLDENGERVEMSVSARNRMTGNGVASPVAAWLAARLRDVHEDKP